MATTKKRSKRPSKTACKRRAKALPKKRTARAGKALAACRPVEQSGAQPLLQGRDLLADQRALACQVIDGVYVRLVDVPRALTLRKYAAPIDVVLDVVDEFCPWNTGRWHLRGGPDGAECETTTAPADFTMSVRDLGASYLGGVSLQALANAGLVEERTPGSVHRAAVGSSPSTVPICSKQQWSSRA